MKNRRRRRPALAAEPDREPFGRSVDAWCHNLLVGTGLVASGRRASVTRNFDLIDPLVRIARTVVRERQARERAARAARGIVRRPSKKKKDAQQMHTGYSDKDLAGEPLLRTLRTYVRTHGRKARAVPAPGAPLAANTALLKRLLDLSDAEIATLVFVTAAGRLRDLGELVGHFGDMTTSGAAQIIGAATGIGSSAAARALLPASHLVGSGLVTIEPSSQDLVRKVVLKAGLSDLLLMPRLTREEVFERFLPRARKPQVGPRDFAHVREPFETARQLLRAALSAKARGVNVLLHGPTGTGKTEMARLLSAELHAPLHVAGLTDANGESANAFERLTSLRLGQRLLGNARALILFDEVEDLFSWKWMDGRRDASPEMSKQWFNEMLEMNPVPTLWITNVVSGIDPAFLRRFSYAIEMKPPSARVRARVLSRHLGKGRGRGSVSESDVDAIAQRFHASPAQLAHAVETARLVASGDATQPRPKSRSKKSKKNHPQESVDRRTIERVLTPVEKIVTGSDPARREVFDASGYRLDAISTRENLVAVADRLADWKPGPGPGVSLLLYGPPGTGKSEFARYLAWRMDRRLVYRRASDLLSMWVGETEKHIAAAFDEAEQDDAVLLVDEADSFLQDRGNATRSWEVTQVNEFLAQLESYKGVAICTTNLLADLDAAAMRRFVLKVEFRFLDAGRSWTMLEAMFAKSVAGASKAERAAARGAIAGMANLAPGDFAAVQRRFRALKGKPSLAEVLAALRAELSVKKGTNGVAGF